MIKKLYIIGNGFDLFHEIPSSYRKFGEFLENEAPSVFDHVNQYLFSYDDNLWSNFEENLANLDVDSLLEEASESLVGYGAEDWSDAYHHDYQYEIEQVVRSLSKDLLFWFSKWVRQLEIPSSTNFSKKILSIDKNAMFLTFNYTPTLNHLYNIAPEKIVYLHGNSSLKQDKLLLGHGWITAKNVIDTEDDLENIDSRIEQGNEIINNFFKTTFKATDNIILSNQNFFQSLGSLEKIVVLGHSLSNIDIPYFKEILKNINASKVRWEVSYYLDIEPIKLQIEKLGVDKTLVTFISLEDFVLKT